MEISGSSLIERYSQKEPDELLALHQSGSLSDTAYSAIESVMENLNIDIPERPEQDSNIQTEDSLKQLWKGSKSFIATFWIISIAGSLFVILLAVFFVIFLVTLYLQFKGVNKWSGRTIRRINRTW
jgi:hypothetical protein